MSKNKLNIQESLDGIQAQLHETEQECAKEIQVLLEQYDCRLVPFVTIVEGQVTNGVDVRHNKRQ